jgi:predicted DNA binding CopG/RHH family protein
MKKANKNSGRTITRTIAQIENRKITKAERARLKRLAALPDDQIDTSDIPEVKNFTGWVRVHEHPEHPLHRVLSRLLSIRLPEPDIALAQRLAEAKGLPYQTYIKSLLHEALQRESARAEGH